MQFKIPQAMLLQCVLVTLVFAQERVGSALVQVQGADNQAAKPSSVHPESTPSNYILGPDDQITVLVSDVEELNNKQSIRVDMKGDINLPLVGRLHAGGLTADQLESEIRTRLKNLVHDPDVVVSISDFHSQPVSVLGAVTNPGVHQLEGHKTLFEVLSLAGGLRPDAGSTVKITRSLEWGRVPLPGAKDDVSGRFSIASADIKPIMSASDPSQNIEVKPNDVISVPQADIIYAVGCVRKPGGFLLGRNESLSALQVLSLAEGLDRFAAPQRAKIIRSVPGTPNRTEIAVDLKKLMTGKGTDVFLTADDVLFVPTSSGKAIAAQTGDALLKIGTGIAVYGRY
jgi:polysaccharide export outer membrane protein